MRYNKAFILITVYNVIFLYYSNKQFRKIFKISYKAIINNQLFANQKLK